MTPKEKVNFFHLLFKIVNVIRLSSLYSRLRSQEAPFNLQLIVLTLPKPFLPLKRIIPTEIVPNVYEYFLP